MREDDAFLNVKRAKGKYRPVQERVKDFRDVAVPRDEKTSQEQATRCMDCGTPFCHWACPIGNYVPDWNQELAKGNWEEAYRVLQRTNNIPEMTGRLCPALCESACVLVDVRDEAVTNRDNELAVVEHAFANGYVKPHPPSKRTGKKVAIVGSGPAGLCCADQLNKAGHKVTVYEKADKLGGMLRYGIPDFKLEKHLIDRRVAVWVEEGIDFKTSVNVGQDLSVEQLLKDNDAICLAGGSRRPRDLPVLGRELQGIHYAMPYLTQSNQRVMGAKVDPKNGIDAKGKNVVVIGGGDTGSDCVGTANRQGARQVVQIELLPKPPESLDPDLIWPDYPAILKTTTSHEEGGERDWSILTKRFIGEKGQVKKLACVRIEFIQKDKKSRPEMKEIPGSEFEIEADLVILAMGFLSPEGKGLLEELGVERDERENVKTDENYQTSIEKVFSAGDMHRGQSLVAWAVCEGRNAAHYIDTYLMGKSKLPLMR
ncbi:MAG: glutamate synthase subunit beta [Candidatus Omnitrophica bacterium]|nr:glutamate synthase subunit beta [Candidatus Omnitrophota bacterium]